MRTSLLQLLSTILIEVLIGSCEKFYNVDHRSSWYQNRHEMILSQFQSKVLLKSGKVHCDDRT